VALAPSTSDPRPAPALVPVSVTSGTRRIDLVLPGCAPVAELVPELASRLGLLDEATACAGYRAVTRDGLVLCPDLGLTAQGVGPGNTITIAPAAAFQPPTLADDVAEALADVVHRDVEPWRHERSRRATLCSGVVLLVLGAGALVSVSATRAASSAPPAAAILSGLLLVTAALFSRVRGEDVAAATVGNLACLYAAAAGLCWGWSTSRSGTPVTLAGVGVIGAGLVGVLAMARARLLLLPAVAAGAVCLTSGLLTEATTVDPALTLTMALAVALISSSAFPALALSASGAGRHAAPAAGTMSEGSALPVDTTRLATEARVAREILVAASATVGLLLVLLAPVAVSCSPAGAAVPVLGSSVVLLRTRRYRSAVDVLTGLVSGVLGLVSTAVSLLWLHPSCRFATAVVGAGAGVVLLGRALSPRARVRRHSRAPDRLEAAALVLLIPALLATAVSVARVQG